MLDSLQSHAVACQAPLSMGFSRQEYWSVLSFPFPWYLPHSGIKPRSPALQEDALPSEGKNFTRETPLLVKWNLKVLIFFSILGHSHLINFFTTCQKHKILHCHQCSLVWSSRTWVVCFSGTTFEGPSLLPICLPSPPNSRKLLWLMHSPASSLSEWDQLDRQWFFSF